MNDTPQIPTKVCKRCGLEKPLRKFGRNRSYVDGYQPECKRCQSKARRAYRKGKSFKKKDTYAKVMYDLMKKNHLTELDGSNKMIIRKFCNKTGLSQSMSFSEIMYKLLHSKEGASYFEDNGYVTKTISYTKQFKSIKLKDQKK